MEASSWQHLRVVCHPSWRRSRLVRELFSIVFSPVALYELASAQTASALAFHGHLAQRCRWADNFLSDSDGQLDDED